MPLMLEKTLEITMDSQESKVMNDKTNQSIVLTHGKIIVFGLHYAKTGCLDKSVMLETMERKRKRGQPAARLKD